MKVLLLLALLAIPIQAQTTWKLLTSSTGKLGTSVFWDGKMEADGKNRTMWLKFVPNNRRAFIAARRYPKATGYLVQHFKVFCGKQLSSAEQTLVYDSNGAILETHPATKPVPIVPDSLQEELYTTICTDK